MLKHIVALISFIGLSGSGYSQILPNSPLAYKKIMTAKKTNMCYIIRSKVEDGKIQDTLIFNFKDFIYDFETNSNQIVTIELTKILKNYSDCKGKGGLKIDFKVDKKNFRTEKYCANPKKVIGKNDIYTCFYIEEAKKKTKSKQSNCYSVGFFKKKSDFLDKVRSLKRKDVNLTENKKVCL